MINQEVKGRARYIGAPVRATRLIADQSTGSPAPPGKAAGFARRPRPLAQGQEVAQRARSCIRWAHGVPAGSLGSRLDRLLGRLDKFICSSNWLIKRKGAKM